MVTQGEAQRFASKAHKPDRKEEAGSRAVQLQRKGTEAVISGPSGVFCSGDPDTADRTFWNAAWQGEPPSETPAPGPLMRKRVPGQRDLVLPLHFW